MMERMVVSMALTVGEEHTASRKAAVSGEEARAKMRGRDAERLPRKAVGERWAADGIPRPPDRCDIWAWVWQWGARVRRSAEKPDSAKASNDAAAGSSIRCSAAQRARESERRQAGTPREGGVLRSRYAVLWARDMESMRKPTCLSSIWAICRARVGMCSRSAAESRRERTYVSVPMGTPTTSIPRSGAREIPASDRRRRSSGLTTCPGGGKARDFPGDSSMFTSRRSLCRAVKSAMAAESRWVGAS